MMELRKLYGDLSDREKQIANDHFLYLTQLDYIDFSSKFGKVRAAHTVYDYNSYITKENGEKVRVYPDYMLEQLTEVEQIYQFIHDNMGEMDRKLSDYKFWNDFGDIADKKWKVHAMEYGFCSERNMVFRGVNVRDLILELDRLYNSLNNISGTIAYSEDRNLYKISNEEKINRISKIAECLNILRVFLEIHPEIKKEVSRLKGEDITVDLQNQRKEESVSSLESESLGENVSSEKNYYSAFGGTINVNLGPEDRWINLDKNDFDYHIYSEEEINRIKKYGSDADKMNVLLSIIETHYITNKEFYESVKHFSKEYMLNVVSADIFQSVRKYLLLNEDNSNAINNLFGSVENAVNFLGNEFAIMFINDSLLTGDVNPRVNAILNKIKDEKGEINFNKFFNNQRYKVYIVDIISGILVSEGTLARKECVRKIFGESNIYTREEDSVSITNYVKKRK